MDRATLIADIKRLASEAERSGEQDAAMVLGNLVAALATNTERQLRELTYQHAKAMLPDLIALYGDKGLPFSGKRE